MSFLTKEELNNLALELNTDSVISDVLPEDKYWVVNAFMVPAKDLKPADAYGSIFDADTFKFTDTSMGGSISLNVFPQFTRYADIKMPSQVMDRNDVTVTSMAGNFGMGHYYSEALDDNSVNVYLEFGVPNFNNILFYFLSATDYRTAVIANEGRSPLFYDIGKLTGTAALILAFPYITIPALLIKGLVSFLGDMGVFPGRFDYYSVKPTMFNYWSSVNSLVTMMATELGILAPAFMSNTDNTKVGFPVGLDQSSLDAMKKMMPGILTTGNVINVHAMVGAAQKRFVKLRKKQLKTIKDLAAAADISITGDHSSDLSKVKLKADDLKAPADLWDENGDLYTQVQNTKMYSLKKGQDKDTSLIDYLKSLGSGGTKKAFTDTSTKLKRKLRKEDSSGYLSSAFDTLSTVFNEGARYAIFKVESLGSVSESFSSNTTTVDTIETVNSMGKTWRSLKFNMDGGNLPGVSNVIHAVTDFAVGHLDGITMGLSNVVGSFLSGMNLDAPMRWDDSSFNLPTLSFKMRLISPSAHPMAQLRGIYIPLASIMAAALPRATGPRSYTSPFVCTMFLRGYQRITLGMITSLSISRGTSNLPFNKYMKPLAVDVDFTVTDFSQVVTSPTPSTLMSSGSVAYDDESGISRYISSLCGRDLFSSTHISSRFKIKFSNFLKSYALAVQPETIGAMVGDFVGTNFLFSMFSGNTKMVSYNDTLGNDSELNKILMGN